MIFERLHPPSPDLLFRRNDPNDIRLGETVLIDPADYPMAEIVLIGLPQDEGVRRNKGRPGAAAAPDAIRRCLYRLVEIRGLRLFDLGNTILRDTLEATHDAHREIVRQALSDDKIVIVLGGGNDTSYPDCSALSESTGTPIFAINVDAHFDVRADTPRNSGTPYRQLLEEGFVAPENFIEFGWLPFANSPTYQAYLENKGVRLVTCQEAQQIGVETRLKAALAPHENKPIFWGIDMDVVCASDAPGVSAPNPLGLTGAELCAIARIAGEHPHTRLFELTEVNPTYDIDDHTCRLAAAAIWTFLSAAAKGH